MDYYKFDIISKQFFYSIIVFAIFIYVLVVFCPNAEEDFIGLSAENDKNLLDKIFNRLYFGLLLVTTNGYSEIRPNSNKCRFIVTIFLAFLFLEVFNIILLQKFRASSS